MGGIARFERHEEIAALLDLEPDVHAGFLLRKKITSPSAEIVGPGFDGIDVAAGLGRREAGGPAVILLCSHGNARPFVGGFQPPQKLGGEHGMAIANNIDPYLHGLAGDPLDRKTAGVDDGVNVFDVDAATRQVADRRDSHVRCHGSVVLCRPVSPG